MKIITILCFVFVSLLIIVSCTETPTESPVRDNPADGRNPNAVPEITDIIVGYGGDQVENPVPFIITHNGVIGAVDQMMIGQVDNSGDALNGSWQSFDTTAIQSFTGSFGSKWLAAKVRALNGNESAVYYKSFTLGMNSPTSLSAQVDELSITLNWEDNSSFEDGYKIERKVGASGAYTQIAVLGSNVESYSDTGLQENQTYYYRVRAYNGTNNSSYSNEADGTTTYLGGYEQTFDLGTTGETIEMVWIPSGSFMQGRYSGEQGSSSNEDPPHLVTLDYGFWLGKYELTQSQWEAVTGSNPSHNYGVGDNYPVYYVSWNMITNDFLPTLNGQTTTGEWRLPSESEWEYSCRAGTETRFYWGDDLSETEIDDYAVYNLNDPGGTAEVGTKLPNAWNLYDMSGNVWEWVEDYWHSNYDGAPTNGDPWLSPASSYRVLRGGSWLNYASNCRSANRSYDDPSNTYFIYGFRIVFSP